MWLPWGGLGESQGVGDLEGDVQMMQGRLTHMLMRHQHDPPGSTSSQGDPSQAKKGRSATWPALALSADSPQRLLKGRVQGG